MEDGRLGEIPREKRDEARWPIYQDLEFVARRGVALRRVFFQQHEAS